MPRAQVKQWRFCNFGVTFNTFKPLAQAGVEQLERQQKEALAIAEQAERLKAQATQVGREWQSLSLWGLNDVVRCGQDVIWSDAKYGNLKQQQAAISSIAQQ